MITKKTQYTNQPLTANKPESKNATNPTKMLQHHHHHLKDKKHHPNLKQNHQTTMT